MTVDQGVDPLPGNTIQSKRLIRFSYKNNERIVEPHDYGVQNGIVRLFLGKSAESSGRLPGWRVFEVDGIQECEVLDQHFAGSRDVSGKHHHWY
jgi:hypothetical protein